MESFREGPDLFIGVHEFVADDAIFICQYCSVVIVGLLAF